MTGVALSLREITKRFGGVLALDGASLDVRPGTVHALLGENGAGKTTLMRIAFGMVRPDAGSVQVGGRPVEFRSPAQAIAAGIGMVHQHFALVPTMTVAENVALGGNGRYSARRSADLVRLIGKSSGLHLDPEAIAGELPVSGQQRLEIVKALARDAKILILDEPTAVLAPAEVADLLYRLRAFADTGRTVVLITHKLREALSIADEVTVLRHGATVLSAPAAEASEQSLVTAILGRARKGTGELADDIHVLAGAAASGAVSGAPHTKDLVDNVLGVRAVEESEADPKALQRVSSGRGVGPPVIEAQDLVLADARGVTKLEGATFSIRQGEIVGIAAVEGSGHHELLRALAGRLEPLSGTLIRPAITGFVPEDRQADALILDFSLTENVALKDAGRRRGNMGWPLVEHRTRALLQSFDVRAAAPDVPVAVLSGGNQQKLVLARELEDVPAVLIAENPTRGLDVHSSAGVRERLRAAASAGTAVVVHTSDLDELLALATRILVVYGGRVQEVPNDRDAVGRGMLGVPATEV